MTAEQVQAVAAVATFLAACVAVWATFRAPSLAAEFAEGLRASSQQAEEERRLKLWIFSTLMQRRRMIVSHDAASALNLIDVVYRDSRDVRAAWRSFLQAACERPSSPEKIVERYHSILEKMALALGLSETISISDIHASYWPEGLGDQGEAEYLEVQDKLKRLRANMGLESNAGPTV